MDRPQPVTRELERDLANLRSFNRWFVSHRLVRHFLRRCLIPYVKARIFELATGSGDIPRLMQQLRELATGRIVVADLRRARWLTFAVYFITATIYRDEMTKTDARLSAARAFSFLELRKLAERAGWKNFGHRKFAVGRQAIWI